MWQLTNDELRQAHAEAMLEAAKAHLLPRTLATVDIEERYLRLGAKLKARGLTPLTAEGGE